MKTIIMYENTKRIKDMIQLKLDTIEKNESILKKEKEDLLKLHDFYQTKISQMNQQLKQLKGVEYSLYYELIHGSSVNKAIDKVAAEYDMSPSTIWKSYYPELKQEIEKLRTSI